MKAIVRLLFIVIGISIALILLWASVDKLIKLNQVSYSPDLFGPNSIEIHYKNHLPLALAHILPGIIFIVLGGLQFSTWIRNKYARIHRKLGAIFLLLTAVISVTAIVLALFMPYGNWIEQLTTLVFGIYLLFASYKAYWNARKKKFNTHKKWVIRVYFIGLSVSTVRGVIVLFLLMNWADTVQEAFGIAFLLGFTINLLFVEIYLKYFSKSG